MWLIAHISLLKNHIYVRPLALDSWSNFTYESVFNSTFSKIRQAFECPVNLYNPKTFHQFEALATNKPPPWAGHSNFFPILYIFHRGVHLKKMGPLGHTPFAGGRSLRLKQLQFDMLITPTVMASMY